MSQLREVMQSVRFAEFDPDGRPLLAMVERQFTRPSDDGAITIATTTIRGPATQAIVAAMREDFFEPLKVLAAQEIPLNEGRAFFFPFNPASGGTKRFRTNIRVNDGWYGAHCERVVLTGADVLEMAGLSPPGAPPIQVRDVTVEFRPGVEHPWPSSDKVTVTDGTVIRVRTST